MNEAEYNIKKSDIKKIDRYMYVCPSCGCSIVNDYNPTVNPDFSCDICGCKIYVEDFE